MGGFFKHRSCPTLWITGGFCLCLLSTSNAAKSQIIPDGTLPSVVIPNGNISVIEGGTRSGSNLFHSFQQFSIPTNSETFFNNTLDIQNIFSRVTGSSSSNIDGLIRANGTANLFIINPNGIIFGPNAQLNIGGSFIGSTAESIKFSDGSEFNAKTPQAPPLLTINVPIGLQFGSNPGRIVNQSQASSNAGLQVLPGQTLALVGGDVILDGGNLTAFQGQIELGSVANSGFVSITPTVAGLFLGYQGIQNFGNILLSRAAAVNASGLGGGTIQVQGGQVTLTEGSRLIAETFGNFNGGGIEIQATQFKLQDKAFVSTSTFGSGAGGNLTVRADAVELIGTVPLATSQQLLTGTFNPLNLSDGLFSLSGGSGTAGNISIDTSQLRMQNGANLFTAALLKGNGGNLTLRVSELAELSHGSLLFTGTAGEGNGGNLVLTTRQLRVLNGTSVSTTPGPTSTGAGGNLTVTAQLVELRGTPAGAVIPGGLFTTTLGAGNAGELSVTAGQLVVADGTQISTSTSGKGHGGNLTVTADSVELSGKSPDGQFLGGLLASTSLLTVPGQLGDAPAGDLTVTTRRLSVRDGAQISAATGSAGTAGTLRVSASESIDVSGVATGVAPFVEAVSFGAIDGIVPSAIETNTRGRGNAGQLIINTGRLAVWDGAEIGVRSTDLGSPGNLEVTADSIVVLNEGTISAVNVSANTGGNIKLNTRTVQLNNGAITATSILGEGGDINLQVRDDLVLRNGSEISTRAGTQNTGGGNGGNITINTGVVAVVENSEINANAFAGNGGNIGITTRGIFVSPDSSIMASSTLGFNGVIEINNLNVDPSRGLAKLPENVSDPSNQVSTGCAADRGNQFVITGRGGLPEDPSQTLLGRAVWQDLRLTSQSNRVGEQGRIAQSQSITKNQPPATLVEATEWIINAKGQMELVAHSPEATLYGLGQKSVECPMSNAN
jgi:filamentous hemagglutinin family protein